MMATIRLSARLFKAAKKQFSKLKAKTIQKIPPIRKKLSLVLKQIKERIKKIRDWFHRGPNKHQEMLLIARHGKIASIKKLKKLKRSGSSKQKKIRKKQVQRKKNLKSSTNKLPQVPKATLIANFYKEWEECFGPALTSLDRAYLESLDTDTCLKVIGNARLTLRSPYLKAVYNGLKDLEDISDLLEYDLQAQAKTRPTFQYYLECRPDEFHQILDLMHDKGNFPTRSGERRLSLDPRLIPAWLNLGSKAS